MFMFDRKKAEMQTTAVEKVGPLVITSPEISKQHCNTMNVNLKLQRKRETNYKKGRFAVILGTFITVMGISKKPYTTMTFA